MTFKSLVVVVALIFIVMESNQKLSNGYTSANHTEISVTTLATITPLLSVFLSKWPCGTYFK